MPPCPVLASSVITLKTKEDEHASQRKEETDRMEVLVPYFAKLAGPPDEPAVLFSREFFGRAYSWSNDGWVMTWASLATRVLRVTACGRGPVPARVRTEGAGQSGRCRACAMYQAGRRVHAITGAHRRARAAVARRRACRVPEEGGREAGR